MKTYINGNCIEQIITNAVTLTQQEYDNLPSTEKNHGTYIISDADTPDIPAEEVSYDNTTSGLTATDTQSAIDELEESLSDTQDQLFMPIMVSKNYKEIGNINTIDLTIKAPTRYTSYQGFFYARYAIFSICIIIGGSSTIISCELQKITNGSYNETITTTIDNSGTDKVVTLQSNYDWNRFAISLWETDTKTNEELKNSFTLSNGRLIS